MRQDDINKDLYSNINISEEMKKSLINDVKKGKRTSDMRFRYSTAIMALGIAGVIGFGGFGASAAYLSYKNRIQDMTVEEQTDYKEELAEDTYETDKESMTRELTSAENKRYIELQDAYYKEGKFPENSLKFVDKLSDVSEDEVAFVEEINKIRIPDGELSDEQLLQLIDHEAKYLYTIEQNAVAEEDVPVEAAETDETDETVETDETNEEALKFAAIKGEFEVSEEEKQIIKEQSIAMVKKYFDVEITDSWSYDVYGLDWSDYGEMYEVNFSESDAPGAPLYQLEISKNNNGYLSITAADRRLWADCKEYTREEAEQFVEKGKADVLHFLNEKFDLGESDKVEIGGFENGLGEETTSMEITYALSYGKDTVCVSWLIDNGKITFVHGDNLLK